MGTAGLRGQGASRGAVGALAALGVAGLFVYFFRLGTPTWLGDEVVYRDAGYQYVHGKFELALENPPLAKYVLGLAQVAFGSGHFVVRAPAALAGLLTGVVLFLFGRREAGIWAGVLALALWVLLPRPELVGPYDLGQVKIDRYARQEVFMAFLTAVALLAGWRWSESGRLRTALVSGAALGLAVACKAPAVLTLPAILATGLVTLRPSRRTLGQCAAICAAAALAAAAMYVPMGGEAPDAIDFMFATSDWRDAIGHPFVFDGTLYEHPPWWASFWWQWKAVGTPAALVLLACLVASPFVLRRGPAVLLLGAVLVPAAFLAFGLSYALPYYYYTWEPPLLLLCALVLHALLVRGGVARIGALVLLVPLAVAAVGVLWDVAHIERRDYAAVAALAPGLRPGPIVTWDLDSYTAMSAEDPGRQVTFDPRGDSAPAAIIVDPASSDRRRNETIIAYLRDNRADLRRTEVDRLRVYVPVDDGAARRLAAASRKREPVNRGVVAIRRCLSRQGLTPTVPTPIPGAPSQGVKAELSGSNRGNFWVYGSVARAHGDARAIDAFLARGGGRAAAHGRVVVGYSRAPTSAEQRLLESCADRGERALG
jgi:hypothetical protein